MPRPSLLVALVLLLVPPAVEAQPRLMFGGGVTSPNGSISDIAETGYHIRGGLHLTIPTLPVGLRADGDYHKLSSADAAFDNTSVLAGALSLVIPLPGVGLAPYFFGGIGSYRTDSGALGATAVVTDSGYHGGFGINLGAVGLGGFVEIRYVVITGDGPSTKLIPLTFGLRL
jgi:hypothetical protein